MSTFNVLNIPDGYKHVIFIKISKNSSSTFVEVLKKYSAHCHVKEFIKGNYDEGRQVICIPTKEVQLFREYYPEVWSKAYKVAIIRNPYDRLISGWKYDEESRGIELETIFKNLPEKPEPISGFDWRNVESERQQDLRIFHKNISELQTDSIFKGTERFVQELLRFEHFDEDAVRFFRSLGLPVENKMIVKNKGKYRERKPLMDHFSQTALSLVNRHFERDFLLLNYPMIPTK